MEKLAIHLALHGAAVLTIGILGGLMLYLAILRRKETGSWHVVHAGGTARGIMLIALAAIIQLPALPFWKLATMVFLLIFFVWTSMAAMVIRALTGEPGFRFEGSAANRFVWVLYALGTVAVVPGCILLIHGLLRALWLQG
jgi:hypothetical protein